MNVVENILCAMDERSGEHLITKKKGSYVQRLMLTGPSTYAKRLWASKGTCSVWRDNSLEIIAFQFLKHLSVGKGVFHGYWLRGFETNSGRWVNSKTNGCGVSRYRLRHSDPRHNYRTSSPLYAAFR